MPRRMRSVAPIFLLLTLPGLASCQSGDPVRERDTAADAVPGPQLNPDPKHIVRVHGRLPKHLDLSLNAEYEATRQGAGCQKQFVLGSLAGGAMRRITDSVDIHRHGEEFDATLIVDKYLPGQCGWTYQESRAAVWKHTDPDDLSTLIVLDGTRYAVNENTPRCTPRHRNCREERLRRLGNHDESIPVLIRCYTDKPLAGESKEAYFTCGDMFNEGYKIKHLIVPETGQVHINIYDLDVDADPAPLRN